MLRRLSVRNIVLIEALDLDFSGGLGAMTGETGAGKSILLDALGAALGARAGADLMRMGADSAVVIAEFELEDGHPALGWLAEQGYPADEDSAILRRVISANGRSRAFINDTPASVAALRELGALLVELHGPFDDRALIDPAGHRALLDAYAGLGGEVAALRALHAAWREVEKALDAGRAAVSEAERDAEYVRHSVEELEKLAPEPGEEDVLDRDRRQMQRAASIAEDVAKSIGLLGPQGAEGAVADALRRLDAASAKADGRLDPAIAALEQAANTLSDALAAVESAGEALSFDPGRLEQVEERLFALRALARKHRIGVEALAGLRESLGDRMRMIDAGAERIGALEAAAQQGEAAYRAAAERLSAARQEAAGRLDAQVVGELAPLKLERAVFRTVVAAEADRAGPEGIDRVAFEVTTNPGSAPGPIDKIASGGELSRFLLALKVCLAREGDGKTLIFDEIDRGVGGATAAAIGARLRLLGESGQTLVITHAPQVAAEAARQWRIEKRVEAGEDGEITRTDVVELGAAERVDEIARMLAGETVTKEARGAAKRLLGAG